MPRNAATGRVVQQNYNAALSFAGGSGSVVSISDASDLRFATGFTVVARAFLNTRTGDPFKGIVSKGGTASGGERNYLLALNTTNTVLQCGYEIVGGANQFASGTRVVPLSQWFMPGVTWDGANVQCYQNGTTDGSPFAASGTPCMTAADLEIGRNQNTNQEWDGIISDVIIWNRALSAQEMSDLYFSGIIPTNGFVDRWRLDEGAGGTANSQTGTHNGTVTSAVWTGNTPSKARKLINGNLVKNGDFEYAPPFTAATATSGRWVDGTATGSTTNDLFGWYHLLGVGTFKTSFDSATSYAGGYSLKIEATDITGRGRATNCPFETTTTQSLIQQYGIPVLANTDYTLAGYVKTNNVVASSVRLNIQWFTGNGTAITTSTGTYAATTQDWTLMSSVFTAPALTQYARIVFDWGTAGTIGQAWVDNLNLLPVYPEGRVPANGNLVKNFDFEVAPTFVAVPGTTTRWIDGTSAGSTTNSTYKWAIDFSGTVSCRFDPTVFYSGTSSMKLSTAAVASWAEISSVRGTPTVLTLPIDGIRMNPGVAYTCRFRMKTNYVSGDATNGAALIVQEYNAAATQVASTISTYVKTTTDWTEYELSFTANAATQFARIQMRLYGHQGAGTLIMDAWFDDIYLAPTTNPGRVVIT